jgi:hypothetical protein
MTSSTTSASLPERLSQRLGIASANDSTDGDSAPQPVTVLVERRVAPGAEPQFEQWIDRLLRAASRFSGFLGGGVLRPHSAGQPWHVVYRFADDASQRRWEASAERARLLDDGDRIMSETGVRRVSGLEPWFALPGRTAAAPQKWKMALVTLLAVFPLALTINALLLPQLAGTPLVLRVLVFTGILTPTMTWVVMPALTRLLADWLYPSPSRRT